MSNMTVFAELDSMVQIPEEQPYGSLFSDMLTEVDGMHPEVRQLIAKNARLNTDNVLLVEKDKQYIANACAKYHDVNTVAYLAKNSKLFDEMPYQVAARLVPSLPVLETLYEYGHDLTQYPSLQIHFFIYDNAIANFFISNNPDELKNHNTAVTLLNNAVMMNDTQIVERLVASGVNPNVIELRSLLLKPEKDSMDMLVFINKLGVDVSPLKDHAFEFAIKAKHDEALNLLLNMRVSFNEVSHRFIRQHFGTSVEAVKSINEQMHPHLRYLLIKRRAKKSKAPISKLILESPEWLKPIYIQVMAEGL